MFIAVLLLSAYFICSYTLWQHDPGMGVLMYHAGRDNFLPEIKKGLEYETK